MGAKRPRVKKTVIKFVIELLAIVVITTIVFHYVVIPVKIDGQSMYPTLKNEDNAIVNALNTDDSGIKRFDIVVIEAEQLDKKIIKRVIGLPGDTVVYKNDKLYINNNFYEELYLDSAYMEEAKELYNSKYFTNDFEVTVDQGKIFVLGDNRLKSADSRVYGSFSYEQIVGKKGMVIFPLSNVKWME